MSGQRAKEALFAIAENPKTFADNQEAAIRALASRGDAETGERLSAMLHPYQSLDIREVLSESLLKLPCNHACVEHVIHYLEQRWYGEKGYEEEDQDEGRQFQKTNQEIEQRLRSVLANNLVETKSVLADEFAIANGSSAPSQFGISLVGNLGLTSMCPELRSSHETLQARRSRKELLDALSGAETKLGCPSSPAQTPQP
jgi:hypothetical protein